MKKATPQPHTRCLIFLKNIWSETALIETCPLFVLNQAPDAVAAALVQPANMSPGCLYCLKNYLASACPETLSS